MSKWKSTARKIIALAYFHRYGWIVLLIICIAIWTEQMLYFFSTWFFIYSIWTFVGYKLKWRHIFCSYQNAYRKKMTPYFDSWEQIKKSDAYGVPLFFFLFGLVSLIVMIIYS